MLTSVVCKPPLVRLDGHSHRGWTNEEPLSVRKLRDPGPVFYFFFNDTATPEFYPLPLHDAFPISQFREVPMKQLIQVLLMISLLCMAAMGQKIASNNVARSDRQPAGDKHPAEATQELAEDFVRSEEHTSELQSPCNLVCRLLLEKK